jgi:uncharacterized membrane protein YeaQ/YmgE (transglycosylase-associated protein family)
MGAIGRFSRSHNSPALIATLRALCGETEPHVITLALGDRRFAHVLALTPGVDPVISALGALAGWVPGFLVSATIESPPLHTAVISLIGTDVGERVLPTWAEVVPTGWGRPMPSHRSTRCSASAAIFGRRC